MLTQHYLSFLVKKSWEIIDLQCCNYCHLLGKCSSKFQSSMTIFHHKLRTREGRVLTNGWTHLSSMTIFCSLDNKKSHPKSYHSDIKYHMKLKIIFSVHSGTWKDEIGSPPRCLISKLIYHTTTHPNSH